MDPDTWAVVTTGVVILVAIAASNRSLRRELGDRIDALSGHLGEVRERLARVEGLLEGLGLARWKRADTTRGDRQGTDSPLS